MIFSENRFALFRIMLWSHERPRCTAGPRLQKTIYAALDALALTPLRKATVFSLVLAAFSSLRFVVRKRTI